MAVGDTKRMYRRNYICVNPDSSAGPDTWRLASPQEVGAAPSNGNANISSGPDAPTNPNVDDLWYNTTDGRLYIYYKDADSEQWVETSPNTHPEIEETIYNFEGKVPIDVEVTSASRTQTVETSLDLTRLDDRA